MSNNVNQLFRIVDHTVKWFKSFLTGRKQRVKIGKTLSELILLNSGVPQGGILSPIIKIESEKFIQMLSHYFKPFSSRH